MRSSNDDLVLICQLLQRSIVARRQSHAMALAVGELEGLVPTGADRSEQDLAELRSWATAAIDRLTRAEQKLDDVMHILGEPLLTIEGTEASADGSVSPVPIVIIADEQARGIVLVAAEAKTDPGAEPTSQAIDDLCLIRDMDGATAQSLPAGAVTCLADIAGWTADDIAPVTSEALPRSPISSASSIEQAAILASGTSTRLSRAITADVAADMAQDPLAMPTFVQGVTEVITIETEAEAPDQHAAPEPPPTNESRASLPIVWCPKQSPRGHTSPQRWSHLLSRFAAALVMLVAVASVLAVGNPPQLAQWSGVLRKTIASVAVSQARASVSNVQGEQSK